MPKSRDRATPTPGEPKRFTPEESARAIGLLTRRLSEVQGVNPAQTRYDSPEVVTIEDAIRATIRDVFGTDSPEAGGYGYFRFVRSKARFVSMRGHDNSSEVEADARRQFLSNHPKTIALLQGLIQRVEERTVGGASLPNKAERTDALLSRRVFVVHGHNEEIKQAVGRVLEQLGLEPVILHEQADKGRTLIEKFEDHGSEAAFAVILMTGDDRGGPGDASHETYRLRARQNVLLEMGFFLGSLGRRRVCVLYESAVEIPSDYAGVLYKKLDEAGAWKFELARELAAAGIEVDANRLLR